MSAHDDGPEEWPARVVCAACLVGKHQWCNDDDCICVDGHEEYEPEDAP